MSSITWASLSFPPVNLYTLPCAFWFYYPNEYNKFTGIYDLWQEDYEHTNKKLS